MQGCAIPRSYSIQTDVLRMSSSESSGSVKDDVLHFAGWLSSSDDHHCIVEHSLMCCLEGSMRCLCGDDNSFHILMNRYFGIDMND